VYAGRQPEPQALDQNFVNWLTRHPWFPRARERSPSGAAARPLLIFDGS
jgi:hypothetical protein